MLDILLKIVISYFQINTTAIYLGNYEQSNALLNYNLNREIICVISYRIYKYINENNYVYLNDGKIINIDEIYNFTVSTLDIKSSKPPFGKANYELFTYLDVIQQKDYIFLINIEKLFRKCIGNNIFEYCKNKIPNIFKTCDYIDTYKDIEENINKFYSLSMYFAVGFNSIEINIIDAYHKKLLMSFKNTDNIFVK